MGVPGGAFDTWRRGLVGPLLAFGAVSCGGGLPPAKAPAATCDKQVISLSIVASPEINATANGQARPVHVRVYQLVSDVRLQGAAFRDIWKDDKAIFGDDLAQVDEIPVYPNSRTEVSLERNKKAFNLAGVALFRNPKGKSWFVSFDIPSPPGAGECGMTECAEGDPECQGPTQNPHFAFWVDQTRIDNGDGHTDPDETRGMRVVEYSAKDAALREAGKDAQRKKEKEAEKSNAGAKETKP